MATTTSPTPSTSSVTSSLITSLGGGSGVDMAALATNLAIAQFAAKTDRLAARSETLDKQISTASNIKSMLSSLASSLGDRVRTGDLSPQPQIANGAIAKVSLSGAIQPSGSYSLEVTKLAAAQTLASQAFTGAATDPAGSGSLKIRFGGVDGGTFTEDSAHAAVDIAIPSGATLSDIASAINGAGAGVTAYVANTSDGAKLVLKGKEGATNGFIVEATEAAGEPGLGKIAWDGAVATDRVMAGASDAAYKLDGLAMTSKSNSVIDAVPGLNLSLTGTNAGTPTAITFAETSSAISTVMADLVSALNEVAAELNTAVDAKTGDLARDSGAQALRRQLSALSTTVVMPGAAEGTPRTLGDLGLSIQRDGTFTLDSTRLQATLKANPQAAAAMFTNGLYGVYGTIDGISRKAATASDPGSLAGSIARYTSQKTQTTDDQAKIAEQQESLRVRMVARFAAADTRIGVSKSTLSFLQNQIDAWNKSD